MIRTLFAPLLLAATVFFFGCQSADEFVRSEDGTLDGSGGMAGAQAHGVGDPNQLSAGPLADPGDPLATRVIYFDYDSIDVRPEYRSVVQAHAAYLAKNPRAALSLEGHADERGSREYNLALGERRVQAVKRQMTVLGASGGQIRTVSYGEERPVAYGHDDQSLAVNRRAELVY